MSVWWYLLGGISGSILIAIVVFTVAGWWKSWKELDMED